MGTIGRLLPGFFPDLPKQSQYNRRLRRLTPWITTVQLAVAELVADGHVRLVDGTLLGCANYALSTAHPDSILFADAGHPEHSPPTTDAEPTSSL